MFNNLRINSGTHLNGILLNPGSNKHITLFSNMVTGVRTEGILSFPGTTSRIDLNGESQSFAFTNIRKSQIETNQSNITTLQGNVSSNTNDIDILQDNFSVIEGQIVSITGNVSINKNDIITLESSLLTVQNDINLLRGDI